MRNGAGGVRRPVLTPRALQRLDRLAQERYAIPSLLLMEHAGLAVAREVEGLLRRVGATRAGATKPRQRRYRVVCACGAGNNGGDGFVAARHLVRPGARVDVFCVAPVRALKGDAYVNARILTRQGVAVRPLKRKKDLERFRRALRRADAVVDALLGIGARGAAREPLAGVIRLINASALPVVAADVPSGLDARTGGCPGACVKARRTVTFAALKTGLVRGQGPRMSGRVRVADIGIPLGG